MRKSFEGSVNINLWQTNNSEKLERKISGTINKPWLWSQEWEEFNGFLSETVLNPRSPLEVKVKRMKVCDFPTVISSGLWSALETKEKDHAKLEATVDQCLAEHQTIFSSVVWHGAQQICFIF